ncbi:MAG: 4-hydroxythreonine-4-phosphate dehydrogenase PdxA, partial [Moraxella sp.]|nr:4-hydroxythreonine-4-phosphate dehydrogenase PdxA [Moraxella sp.]
MNQNNTTSIAHKPIIITTGEPAGIGMDIVLDILANHGTSLPNKLLIAADVKAFYERAKALQTLGVINSLPQYPVQSFDEIQAVHACDMAKWGHDLPAIGLIDVPCAMPVVAGRLNANNAQMVANQLNIAHELASRGAVSAIVTAPIQKSVMIDGGITLDDGTMFSGHTEFFMQKAGCDKVVMMLANRVMKVALVTTHLPLKDVANAITTDVVRQTVQITHAALREQFGIDNPKILVCGLNPHAGEGGYLGTEEIEIINPVLQGFIDDGMDISLAMPADTLFTARHLAACDGVIAMYHDQGLPVLKSHGFGDTVNITLGLPYVRTSVD